MPDPAASSSPGSRDPDRRSELTRSLHRSSGSFELVLAPVLLALLGLWLDRTLGTSPVFTVGLAVFGAVGAAVAQYFAYQQRLADLAADGRLHVERSGRQYHARNRSDGDLGGIRGDEASGNGGVADEHRSAP